jgi:hypothetical protein
MRAVVMLTAPPIPFVSVVFGRWLRATAVLTYPEWNRNIGAGQKMSNVFAISAACPASFSKQQNENGSIARCCAQCDPPTLEQNERATG